jgi:hypothetical protein
VKMKLQVVFLVVVLAAFTAAQSVIEDVLFEKFGFFGKTKDAKHRLSFNDCLLLLRLQSIFGEAILCFENLRD